ASRPRAQGLTDCVCRTGRLPVFSQRDTSRKDFAGWTSRNARGPHEPRRVICPPYGVHAKPKPYQEHDGRRITPSQDAPSTFSGSSWITPMRTDIAQDSRDSKYAAKLLFKFRVAARKGSNKGRLCEERIIQLTAQSAKHALTLGKRQGRAAQLNYRN